MVDRLLIDHGFDIIDFSETFEVVEKIIAAVAQIADDAESELVMRSHSLHDRPRQLAVSGDQDAIETLPFSMPPLDRIANDASPEDDEENRAQHENAESRARVKNVGTLRRANPQKNSGENNRRDDRADRDRQPLLRF